MIQYGVKVAQFPHAPHRYGRAWCYCDDEGVLFDQELSHNVTQEAADTLNHYDGEEWYKAGDSCIRFETDEEVIAEGVRVLRDKYGEGILIQIGEYWNVENPIHEDTVPL